MDGVVGFPRTALRLLQAGELHFVGEYMLASPAYWMSEEAILEAEAGESIVQNNLDVGVVFPLRTPRV